MNGFIIAGAALVAVPMLAAPSIIASVRRSPDRKAIVALNVAGLLAFSCWAPALAWAIFGSRDRSLIVWLRERRLVPYAIAVPLVLAAAGAWVMLRIYSNLRP